MSTRRKKTPARRGASRVRAPVKKTTPGWVWLVCGLALGALLVLLLNLKSERKSVKPIVDDEVSSSAKSITKKPDTETKKKNKPTYDFYTILPESEVVAPIDSVPTEKEKTTQKPVTKKQAAIIEEARAKAALAGKEPPPKPVIRKNNTLFFLQAGSFPHKKDAQEIRAKITLLGQNVHIEEGQVHNQTWYRIMVGPFSTREQLSASQKILKSNGFNNLLLQQRKK